MVETDLSKDGANIRKIYRKQSILNSYSIDFNTFVFYRFLCFQVVYIMV